MLFTGLLISSVIVYFEKNHCVLFCCSDVTLSFVQNRLAMDRCISHQETAARPVKHLQVDDTRSPWDRFDVGDSASFTVRRRSTSPAASTFALSPLSSPCSSYHGDDLGSPDVADDGGSTVETLSKLYINDTMHSRRSLGSNASSDRSSTSNGSAGSASSWTQLPSFHRPLKFVSRPPDLPFAAVPTEASPAKAAGTTTARGGGFRRRNRRNPSIVVEDEDKAAFEQLVGQRRVRKSFMFGKKNANSRQAIDSVLTTSDQQEAAEENSDLFWLDQPVLPPVDYAQTVSARSAEGWQVTSLLKAIGLSLPPRQEGRGKGSKDGKESPVDVEMRSKPPSRESSIRGDESESAAVEDADKDSRSSAGGETTHDDSTSAQGAAPLKTVNTSGGEIGGSVSCAVTTPAGGGNVDSKKRVYGCTVPDCGKVYTKSSHLKSHMRSHTGKCSQSTTLFSI